MEGDLSGGRSRRRLAGLVVAGLVAVSILGRILLGREIPTPWIVPDETIYGILGRTLYSSGRLTIENANSDFYSLVYPALIGGPLAWLSPHRGYEVAKALGAITHVARRRARLPLGALGRLDPGRRCSWRR